MSLSDACYTSFLSKAVVYKTDDPDNFTTVGYEDGDRSCIMIIDTTQRAVFLTPNEALHVSVAIQRLIESQVFLTQPPVNEPAVTPAAAVPAEAIDFDDPLN